MQLLKIIIMITLFTTSIYAKEVVNGVKDSVVKIYTVAKVPKYLEPWNVSMSRSSGSGSIITGNRILTNAHVVANSTFIEVRRYGKRKRFKSQSTLCFTSSRFGDIGC